MPTLILTFECLHILFPWECLPLGTFHMYTSLNLVHALPSRLLRWRSLFSQHFVHSPMGACFMWWSSYLFKLKCSEAESYHESGVESTGLASKRHKFKSWWYHSLPSWMTLGKLLSLSLGSSLKNLDDKTDLLKLLKRWKGNEVTYLKISAHGLAKKKSQMIRGRW